MKGMSPGDDGCRFGWYPKILAFFILAAVGLSVMSSLDCQFLMADVGFVPNKYYSDELGFGLWSYADPGGRCMSYKDAHESGGFSDGDSIYSGIISDDINWTISRILALVGVAFGGIALISIGFNVCKSEPRLVDILAYATTIALLCECAKFGLFLTTDICTDPAYWYNDESDSYSGSVCKIDRGAYMCISSMAAYFVSVIMAVGFAARPKRDAFSHEDESLTSWMGTENEQSAKAQAQAQAPAERRDTQSQYDWSRSAPSTIPSINIAEVEEDYGMEEHMDVLHEQFDEDDIAPIPEFPPHENRSSRRFDDTSTLTWDPGY